MKHFKSLVVALAVMMASGTAVWAATEIYSTFTISATVVAAVRDVKAYTNDALTDQLTHLDVGDLPMGFVTNYRFYLKNTGLTSVPFAVVLTSTAGWLYTVVAPSSGTIEAGQVIPVDLQMSVLLGADLGVHTFTVYIQDAP